MNEPLTSILICLSLCAGAAAQQHQFVYEGADALPSVTIDGESAIIHTQGLYVTDKHYLVTGRLEKKPKRALLLRFPRDNSGAYEFIDITPPRTDGETLDHPGGFDVDSQGRFWIPVSTSHPQGPTLICRYNIDPNKPLTESKLEFSFRVKDHIGALCRLKNNALVGANWDTKTVYYWTADGRMTASVNYPQKSAKGPTMHVAVQDWKLARPENNEVILGGIAKSERTSRAVIQFVNMLNGEVLETHRFKLREDVTRPITNEGLAVHNGKLFLLPEDIGQGAKVLRYQFQPPRQGSNPAVK